MYKSLFGSVSSSNIIDELDLAVLLDEVDSRNTTSTAKASVVRQTNFRGVFTLVRPVLNESTEVRIEDIENETATRLEMPVNALQGRNLVRYGHQVLKGAKWYQDATKTASKIQLPHVRLNETHPRLYFSRFSS